MEYEGQMVEMYRWQCPDSDGCVVVMLCPCVYVMHPKVKGSDRAPGWQILSTAPPHSQVRAASLSPALKRLPLCLHSSTFYLSRYCQAFETGTQKHSTKEYIGSGFEIFGFKITSWPFYVTLS